MTFDVARAKEVEAREDEGRVVQLLDEAGLPMEGVTVTVVGSYSKRYRDAVDARSQRKFRLGKVPKAEEVRTETMALYADCVIAWTGFVENGKDLPCTHANVMKVCAAPWIYEQIAMAVEDHAGFSTASSVS